MKTPYCSCLEPKLLTNKALDKEFKVCAKSIGGCGREYSDESNNKSSTSLPKGFRISEEECINEEFDPFSYYVDIDYDDIPF